MEFMIRSEPDWRFRGIGILPMSLSASAEYLFNEVFDLKPMSPLLGDELARRRIGLAVAPKALCHLSLRHRPRIWIKPCISAEGATQYQMARKRTKDESRFQRWVSLARFPGALPQARDDSAPLALNTYSAESRFHFHVVRRT